MWEDVAIGIIVVCGANLFFASILGFFGYLRYLRHKETIALAEAGLIDSMPEQKPVGNIQTVRSGLIVMGVGMALCIGLYPIGWIAMPGELPLNLGPWMLVGLVPFFVGLALVIGNYIPGIQMAIGQGVQKAIEIADSEEFPNKATAAEKVELREETRDISV